MRTFNLRIFSLFAFIILSWGLAWPVNKIGLDYISPSWYTAIRLSVAAFAMMLVVIAMKKFSLPTKKDMPMILAIGLLQVGVFILLVNLGLTYLPAGRASLLAYTTPLWVMPAAIFIFHESAGWKKWLGFIFALGGLLILLSPWELNWTNHDILFGASMLLLASLCWAISILCARYMHWTKSPLELIPWQLLIGAIPITLLAFLNDPHPQISWQPPLIASLFYTSLIVTGFSYWCGLIINKELPAIIVSLGYLGVPIFSVIISILFLHESITLMTTIAISAMILGLTLITL